MSDFLLALQNVHVNFPARKNWLGKVTERVHALNGLDLQIRQGETLGIVGESGCGKSTLAQLLMGMLKPSQGSYSRRGDKQHNGMQMVFQDPLSSLDPRLPVWRIITEPVWIQKRPAERERRMLAEDLAQQVGIRPEYLDRLPHAFSGGQRQRAWIAMVLAQETSIMLLDEPTTWLDISHQIDLLELLSDLNREKGYTLAAVLHDLNQACRYATHLIALRDGKIIAEGAPKEIVTAQLIEKIYGLRCMIIDDPVAGTPLVVPLGRSK